MLKTIKRILQKYIKIICISCFILFSSIICAQTHLAYDDSIKDAIKISMAFDKNKVLDDHIDDELKYKTLILAAEGGDISLIEALLANGAVINIDRVYNGVYRFTPLMFAISNGHQKAAEILIKAGASVNKSTRNCCFECICAKNALICAIIDGPGSIKLLLDNGADVNYQDNCCGMTPLMHAANGFHILSIETLFKNTHNIDLNKKDKYGRTALMLASKENSPLAVEALLDKKAEVNLQDLEGKTALIWLTSNYINWGQYKDREIEISENLLKHGAMVDLADNHGMTALMIASDRGHASLIKIYLEYGADPYKQNHAGESAIDIAKHKYNRECLTILENHEMMQFVDERAKEEGLTEDEAQEIITELVNERDIRENLEKLNSYYIDKELPTEGLSKILAGKIPVKGKDNKINFTESINYIYKKDIYKETYAEIMAKDPTACNGYECGYGYWPGIGWLNSTCTPKYCVHNKVVIEKQELIKNEWREITADTGELVISFIPVAGPPISVAFSQFIKGEFDVAQLQAGLAWGAADLVGFGFIKRIKNLEKLISTATKIAPNIKITKNIGWKVGEDYNKLTAKGTEPAWNTVKKRFWKNKAATLSAEEVVDLETKMTGNVARMRQGKPPQQINKDKIERLDGDGMESKELHHDPIPKRDGGKLVEDLWPQEHAAKDKFRNPGY